MNKQLLDPLGSACRIIALNFNDISTKLSIHNHILTLDIPTSYQFLIRTCIGDGRENISELYYVIIRIIKWYLTENNEEGTNANGISNSEEIRKIIKYLCDGFRKLQKTYAYGNVILAVQFYINLLEDGLNNNFNDDKLPAYIIEKEREYENLLNYDKLKNFWTHDKLKRVVSLFEQCFILQEASKNDSLIDSYLKSINSLLDLSDNEFKELIKNSNRG